jgi:hypothetical protein
MHFQDIHGIERHRLPRLGMGVAVGDADGNGADDLYVAAYGPDVLLAATERGHFRDVTAGAGLGDPRWEQRPPSATSTTTATSTCTSRTTSSSTRRIPPRRASSAASACSAGRPV